MNPEQSGPEQDSTFTNPVAGAETGNQTPAAQEAKDPASTTASLPTRKRKGLGLLAGAAALLAGIGGAKAVANEQSSERPEDPAPITAQPSPEAVTTTAPAEGQTVTFESAPPGMPVMSGEVQAPATTPTTAEASQGASLGGLEGTQINQGESQPHPADQGGADLGGLEGTQVNVGESEPHPAQPSEQQADLGGLDGVQINEGESDPHPAEPGESTENPTT